MTTLPVVLFAAAALLTFLAPRIAFSLADSTGVTAVGFQLELILLSVVRGGILIYGMLAVARGANATVAVAAVVAMEVASFVLHLATGGAYDSTPHQYGYEAVALILPLLLIAAGFLLRANNALAPILLWAGAALPLIAVVLGSTASDSHKTNRAIDRAEEIAERTAELNALPAGSPVELLLPFTCTPEDYTREAMSRIINSDRAVEQLKEALNGPNAAAAKAILPEVERAVYVNKRNAEFDAVPVSAGLAAVLSFYALGEDARVRAFVEDRIRETPDAEAQLVKGLAGPHALEAIVALRRIEKYKLDDATYAAVFSAAARVAERLDSTNPPPKEQVQTLTAFIGHMAMNSRGPTLDAHRENLIAVYRMSRRAEKEYGYGSYHPNDLEQALGLQ